MFRLRSRGVDVTPALCVPHFQNLFPNLMDDHGFVAVHLLKYTILVGKKSVLVYHVGKFTHMLTEAFPMPNVF